MTGLFISQTLFKLYSQEARVASWANKTVKIACLSFPHPPIPPPTPQSWGEPKGCRPRNSEGWRSWLGEARRKARGSCAFGVPLVFSKPHQNPKRARLQDEVIPQWGEKRGAEPTPTPTPPPRGLRERTAKATAREGASQADARAGLLR